ncbi:transcription termination factor Rho [Eubacterium sp. LFL-14]|uniref:Transcription termination factor Rho n=1 Tax=Eubacterium album TaxID=2978477 RepID=A0ABT2M258_9FIRM|nr:transcription termination factor Rho [Eubacterium sp. LFL-14]MCT7398971.1 transcription termination factor Rho [Eubacterium sp. LFL-14]
MREKLQSLPVSELRAIAKENGIKSVTKLRKQQLVDMILEVNERNQKKQTEAAKKEEVNNDNKENIQIAEVSTEEKEDKPEKEVKKKKSENKEKNSESNKELKTEKKNSHKLEGKTEHRIIKTHSKNENKPVQKVQKTEKRDPQPTDEGDFKSGILEVMPDGFGFIRCDNYMPGDDDVYVAPSQIKRFNLKTGDILEGKVRAKRESEKFGALYYLDKVNDESLEKVISRPNFEDLTPIFPNNRLHLETPSENMAMRIVDIISPIGKGQRGMIVSPPKAGKTTLLKQVAKSIQTNNPEMKMIILLIDERPEEVTDIKEAIEGENVEVIYSTFDELPEHHKRVSEMVIERAKRLVEHGNDVIILLDSITRLARAYNMTVPPSGRTLSGGLDPAALHMPKRFFGAARNMREGGSLTILATALVDTGSKMDDVVYEEFKGTGNMELVLDRKLSEKRVFPAIDIIKSGTRREDLLLDSEELGASYVIRKEINGMKKEDAAERIINLFYRTKNNKEFISKISKIKNNDGPTNSTGAHRFT